jgi:hypothetical protein
MFAVDKDTLVLSLIIFGGGNGSLCWNLSFFRAFQDWELERVNELINLRYSRKISEGNYDCLFCTLDGKGRFSV